MKLQNASKKKITARAMIISIFFFWAFVGMSIIFIDYSPKQALSEYHSSSLIEKKEYSENRERTDYLDEYGNITDAFDLGYSTKICTKTQNGEIERYYDSKGNQVACSTGYYSIYREYNEDGNNIYSFYLGENGEPIMLPAGYSIEKYLYNESGQKETILFLDADRNPVCSSAEGYGKKYEYNDEGKVYKISYLDPIGQPMMIKNGYASIIRSFYRNEGFENGKIKDEFYLDAQGEPIALFLGQYGLHREYNEMGDNTVITYLDIEGHPLITTKGYTTIYREYQGSNYIEKYYDINGQPYKLSEGQYGKKTVNGQTVYLDVNGNEQFNIRNFLAQNSAFVIIFALCVVILNYYIDKRSNYILLLLYFGVVIYFTLMYRDKNITNNNFDLFSAYRDFFVSDAARSSIIKNIWLFIPLGAIIYKIFPSKKALFIPIIISFVIESVQYITRLGWCDMDDIISNSLGGLIGCKFGEVLKTIKNESINKKSDNNI